MIDQKNSVVSTTGMSKYHSSGSGFYSQGRKSAELVYAEKPMRKQLPRWNQSSATWRNTSHRYSFSRDYRFRVKKFYYSDILESEVPSTRSPVSCTFGKDNKKPISEVVLRNAKEKPSPDRYDMKEYDESPRSPNKGKSIGISWSNYKRVHIPHRKDVYSGHLTEKNPPAKYEVRESPGKQKQSFSLYGRLKMFTKHMADIYKANPGAHHRIKDRHLHDMKGMNERNFSFGQRINLSKPANHYPAAIYEIPSFCDKFQKTKRKNCPQ